jgi:hypothetical protein
MTVSYPRRQQLRRLMHAFRLAAGAMIASIGAVLVASAGHAGIAFSLAAAALVLGLLSRRALQLAGRSRVGAESEAQIRRALEPLVREGWRVAHAVEWPGRGDLDHVLRSPSGMGFVIETKTLRYGRVHVARTIDAARWLARKRRRYPRGVLPVVSPSLGDHGRRDARTSAIRLTPASTARMTASTRALSTSESRS